MRKKIKDSQQHQIFLYRIKIKKGLAYLILLQFLVIFNLDVVRNFVIIITNRVETVLVPN